MSDLRTAAQQALEALENCTSEHGHRCNRCDSEVDEGGRVVAALRAALAQQEQANYPEEKLQAVAEYISDKYHVWYGVAARDVEEVLRQSVSCGLVNNPPRREWRGLTEEEIRRLSTNCYDGTLTDPLILFARAIEQVLKERNT
jgi:hypothetical protein